MNDHLDNIRLLANEARQRNLSAEQRQAIARMGGQAGGKARAEKLPAKKRSEIARRAAAARWLKKRQN